ncbi:MAG: TonB-dependent receptor plug domain-containing protein [Gemmatimonadota bacterium]
MPVPAVSRRVPALLFGLCLLLAAVPHVAAQATADLVGRVVDMESGAGIPDVVVRAGGLTREAVTDAAGLFRLEGIPTGERLLTFEHLAYGEHQQVVNVGDEGLELEIRLSPTAIAIEELVVEGVRPEERAQRARGSSTHVVDAEMIQRALGTSRHLGDLLRQTVPGIRMRQRNDVSGADVCLEFRSAQSISMLNRGCQSPQVYLDGVPVSNPNFLYGMLSLHTIERLEVVPPGEAGARYGSGSLYGVILITTHTPGVQRGDGAEPVIGGYPVTSPSSRHFDWSQEPQGHHTGRAFLGAFVGNALGIAAGVSVAKTCIGIDAKDEIVTECSAGKTGTVAVAALLIPTVTSALGARWSGATDTSVGRFAPAAFGAALGLLPGYAFALTTEGAAEADIANAVGYTFLFAAVPIIVTGADRLFRRLRHPEDPTR